VKVAKKRSAPARHMWQSASARSLWFSLAALLPPFHLVPVHSLDLPDDLMEPTATKGASPIAHRWSARG
jgi:hypothetical protein